MKIMMTVRGDFISPRFDMSSEVMIATSYDGKLLEEPHSIIVSEVSAEKICDLALKKNVATVICGGISEQHYQFLNWKKILVLDGIVGPHVDVLQLALKTTLEPDTIMPGVTSMEVST